MNPIFAPWLAECVILTARSVKRDHRAPLPSEFVATFVIFGTASMLANTKAQPAAAVFSWGIVVATLLNLWGADGKIRLQPRQTSDRSLIPSRGAGGTNPAYPGEAPGWRPPMAPGYRPT